MAVARHGEGPAADIRALASQVHPVFMLPAIAASAFGAVLAGDFSAALLGLHATAVFLALYTAHVKDGYVDFHRRGEDEDHPMTAAGCRLALALSTVAFAVCLLAIVARVDVVAGLLTVPGWVIGYFHAPQLDTHPVSATAGYPTGIAFALLGGHYVQASALPPTVLAMAAIFLVVLSGIKAIDDATDYIYDRSIDKRTAAVVLGPRRARVAAFGAMAAGMLTVVGLAAAAVLPPSAVFGVVAFSVVAVVAARAPPDLATMLLIRGSYVFLAILVGAVWFEPLAG